MSTSPSLYRRHRPRSFADVVGQEHVVRTLRNAVEREKVHHAYLFVGSRGTGKTSMAKILAACLNCSGVPEDPRPPGPTTSPCGRCDSCRSIASATSLDVIEMDAASNNSVDDIRDLRERVAYAPVSGRSKVYILDEAHMLSPQAWNAFLKTLEEPPPNTIFVLATTEATKILPTVVDRCHRFDFARPTIGEIAGVLRRVAATEKIGIGEEAVALVARSATGSFRDALGTLEQLLSYSEAAADGTNDSSIALDDVLAVLGVADADLVFSTVDAVASGSAREALLAAARLADSGRDVGRFFSDLEVHARSLMVVQVLRDEVPPELRVTDEQDARLLQQAKRVAPADVVRLLDLLAAGLRAMKDGSDARTQLELALLKAATPALESSAKALMARIERLEARLGDPMSLPTGPPSRAPEAPATAAARAAAAQGVVESGGSRPGRTSVAVAAQVDHEPAVATSTTLPGTPERPDGAAAAALAGRAAQQVSSELATETDPDPAVSAVAVIDPTAPAPERASMTTAVDLDLPAFALLWPAVLESIGAENGLLAASLADAHPASLDDSELTLAWAESAAFSKRKAEAAANRELIAQAIRAVTGSSLRLAYTLRTDVEQIADGKPAEPGLTEEELIARLVSEFDAEELPPDPQPPTES
ncbi:MAG: DNA polymerase III subunit gamma/tau [Solirubrobacterales bacterium]|nr:DNA polymerase III subunit gamma/tau [Solirubrobacterales bacterium]